jgi:hypothetical protein
MLELLPRFETVGQSALLTRRFLNEVKSCAEVEVDHWADKGVGEAFVTYKVSVICKDENGRRLGGQQFFKFRTSETQLAFMTFLQEQRNEFVNIPPY